MARQQKDEAPPARQFAGGAKDIKLGVRYTTTDHSLTVPILPQTMAIMRPLLGRAVRPELADAVAEVASETGSELARRGDSGGGIGFCRDPSFSRRSDRYCSRCFVHLFG